MKPAIASLPFRLICFMAVALMLFPAAWAQGDAAKNVVWKQVAFAILKFNDEPPKSWNIYHTEKHGWILVRLWKRYLLVGLQDQEVYDIDPQTLMKKGETLVWTDPEFPEEPIRISDWNQRDVGTLRRIRFRLGRDGHVLEIQLPLRPDGRPMY
jgi:hypothetical protein